MIKIIHVDIQYIWHKRQDIKTWHIHKYDRDVGLH